MSKIIIMEVELDLILGIKDPLCSGRGGDLGISLPNKINVHLTLSNDDYIIIIYECVY